MHVCIPDSAVCARMSHHQHGGTHNCPTARCAFLYYPPVFNESCNDECTACEGHSDACICMCSQVSDQEELAKLHECRLKVASMVQDIRRQFDIMA